MTAIFNSSPPRKRSRSPAPINNHCPPCTESGYFFRKRNRSAIEYAFGVASFAHISQLLTRCRNALPESPPKRFCDIPTDSSGTKLEAVRRPLPSSVTTS